MKSDIQKGQITGKLSPFLERARLKKIARHAGRGAEILDVGCGRGRILSFVNTPKRYVGVDILLGLIEENRKRSPGVEFWLLDIENEDLPNDIGLFDVVIMGAVIEHFQDPVKIIGKLAQRLREGGRIILTTPSPKGAGVMKIGSKLGLLSREAEAEHERLYGKEDIERVSSKCGLRVVHFERFLLGFNQLAVLVLQGAVIRHV